MNFTVWVTGHCNMQCRYCYVENMKNESVFDCRKIDELVRFIYDESKRKNEKVRISFMGGEPLLEVDLIESIIESLNKRIPQIPEYSLTTNGLLVGGYLDFIKRNKIKLSLSLDGCEKAHDINRIDKSGKGTYKRVVSAYRMIHECGIFPLRVRGTFNAETSIYLKESVKELLSVDRDMSVILVPDVFDRNWDEENISELNNTISELKREGLNNINILGEANTTCSACGGGLSSFQIYMDGRIFPCSYVVNDDSFCIGNITDGLNYEKISMFVRIYSEKLKECLGCNYERYCLSFKCKYLNYAIMHDMRKVSPIICAMENIKVSNSAVI